MVNLSTQSSSQDVIGTEPELSSGFWRMAKNNLRLRQRSLPIQHAEHRDSGPLSFNQERLWWFEQLYPNSSIQNLQHKISFTGKLQVNVLENCLREIVQRHEALRTIIADEGGQPVQIISSEVQLELPVKDLQPLDGTEQQEEIQKLMMEQAVQPFDLNQGPLWRFLLIRCSENEHLLLHTIHHIVFDAWSQEVWMQELIALYEAFLTENPSPLSDLPIQYIDFAQTQRQWFERKVLTSQTDYWKKYLSNGVTALDLPADYLRASVQRYQPVHKSLALSVDLTQAVKKLSAQQGVSLYVTLLAAFKVLLHRYTGQPNLLVNTPVAGRHHSETRGSIGCFINTLPILTTLPEKTSFADFLQQVSQVTEQIITNQDAPFWKLSEVNASESSYTGTGALFVFQNVPRPVFNLPDLTIHSTHIHRETEKQESGNYFDVVLSVEENAGALTASWVYNAALFNEDRIDRMLVHFQTLLESAVQHPEQLVAELPLLSSNERHQLLVEWNDTRTDYPNDKCIHQLFEEQVERTPDAIAVEFYDQQLTYRELNARANQLAHYLQSLGVGPEVMVGLCLERSVDVVVSLLGILKSGGAYIPLDPAYPKDRLAFMLEDSQVSVLLTTQELVDQLPKHEASLICLDATTVLAASDKTNPVSLVAPTNLAYVIYTSGSTGTPKGVLVTHQGLPNLAQAQIRAFKVQPDSRVLQFASFNFDASISEVVMTLCCGAALCLARKEDLLPGAPLMELLQKQKITHVTLPPSALAMLPEKKLPDLKTLIVAGEPCPANLMEKWSKDRTFINAYGPTEVTVCATVAEHSDGSRPLVIGRPIENTHIYILDAQQQPVPVGVPGELYIGSVGLARGYLNRPDLTQERFIFNPFGRNPFEQLYKTGDLARYLPDGNIEFLGRLDHQVKLRGFRIELGEVEAVLAQHPTVQETIAVVRQDRPGDKRLVAYVVPDSDQNLNEEELRSFLKQKLPDYMVPAAFVNMSAFPLTPNGKIDRHALPSPDQTGTGSSNTFVAPRIELERQLIEIWSEVLGVKSIGIRDNFFDIGGNSLLAVQVVAQIEKICGYQLPVIDFFKAQTVERLGKRLLAPLLTKQDWSLPWNPLEPISSDKSKQAHSRAPIFILNGGFNAFLAGAYWIARQLGSEQACYSLHLRGLDGKEAPQDRVEDMAAEAIAGIRKIQPEGPYFFVGLCFGGIVIYEMAQQLRQQNQQLALLAMVESAAPANFKKEKNGFGKANGKQIKIQIPEFDANTQSNPNILRVAQGMHRAKMRYEAVSYPGQLIVFQASEGSEEELQAQKKDLTTWRKLAADVELHILPGDHLSLYKEENIRTLVDKLKECLEEARSRTQS